MNESVKCVERSNESTLAHIVGTDNDGFWSKVYVIVVI
jgi:hypothetical protein